jgi:hypothetical protein
LDKHTVTVKSQVYLYEGEEVVLDDVKVKIIPTGDGERREVTYLARRVSLEGSKYVTGPAFHADKLLAIGRVIPVAEAA